MAQTEQEVVALEMEKVREKLPTLFDWDDTFYSGIEKKDVEVVSARDARIPLEIHPGGNFGQYDPAGGSMGRGSAISYDKAVIGSIYMKHGIEIQYKAKIATDDRRKAIVKNFQRQLAKAMFEFRRQLDSQYMTAGDCAIGTITSISTAGGKDTYTCTTDGFGVRLIRYAQFIAVYPSNFAAPRTIVPTASQYLDGVACYVDLVDLENAQVRINGATTGVTAGDRLVINGVSGANPVGLYGVPYHHNNASTGTWLGLNRADLPEIRASRVTASGAFALPFARLAMNKVGNRVGLKTKIQCQAWLHPCQKQAYEEIGQLVSIIQKQPKSESLDLYFGDNMQMAGAPVMESFSWDKTRIDFVVKEVWGRVEIDPVGFMELGERKIYEVRDGDGNVTAAEQFFLKVGTNAFVDNPAKCAYVSDLSVPTGYL